MGYPTTADGWWELLEADSLVQQLNNMVMTAHDDDRILLKGAQLSIEVLHDGTIFCERWEEEEEEGERWYAQLFCFQEEDETTFATIHDEEASETQYDTTNLRRKGVYVLRSATKGCIKTKALKKNKKRR